MYVEILRALCGVLGALWSVHRCRVLLAAAPETQKKPPGESLAAGLD